MNYLIPIKSAFLAFPFIAFIFTIPFIIHEYHKYGSIHFFRVLIIYSFILYLITIYFLVILPLPTFAEAKLNTGPYINIIPFNFIRDFIKETPLVLSEPSTYLKSLMSPSFYVVIFNIFMTIPFGMYLRYYYKCRFKTTVFYTFLLSLFFELTQVTGLYFIYPNPYRLCDIDDLILNTTGGMLGYAIIGLFLKYLPTRDDIDKEALKLGEKVSGLRRLTVYLFDAFLYLILSLLILLFTKQSFLISALIYYIIIPIIFKNQTIGMRFLNVKMVYNRFSILKNIFRNLFLIVYYIFLPFWFIICVNGGLEIFNLTQFKVIGFIGSVLLTIIFYIINFMLLLFGKSMYYDRLFGFRFESTIKEKEN